MAKNSFMLQRHKVSKVYNFVKNNIFLSSYGNEKDFNVHMYHLSTTKKHKKTKPKLYKKYNSDKLIIKKTLPLTIVKVHDTNYDETDVSKYTDSIVNRLYLLFEEYKT